MNNTLQDVIRIKNLMEKIATSSSDADSAEYSALRSKLIRNMSLKNRLPDILARYENPKDLRSFLQFYSAQWQPRREYIIDQFKDIIQELELSSTFIGKEAAESTLKELNSAEAQVLFANAMERADHDANGAVTAAKSLLESTCKLLLDDMGEYYTKSQDMISLYGAISKRLELHPQKYADDGLKQILSGCIQIVNGLASVRNKLGDAHGQGRKPTNALPRHARLAVSAACTMSVFLIETYKEREKNSHQTQR